MRWCAWFSQGSESWLCFVGSWAVDRERSNRALFSGSESWYLPLALTHIPQSRTKIHHVYSFTKSSTKLILAFAVCTTNYSLLIVRLSGWRNMWVSCFQTSPSLSRRAKCARLRSATQNLCVLLFRSEHRVFEYHSPGCLLLPPLCVELHLKCCNTKIEQTAWNGTCGDYAYAHWDSGKSHMNKRWRKTTIPGQSLAKVGICYSLLSQAC